MRHGSCTIRPMQRAIALLAVLSLLLGNVAWAVDVHSSDFVDHESPSLSLGDLPDKADISHCDHCCHGSAHFQGVLGESPAIFAGASRQRIHFEASACLSRTTAPPTEPPRG